MSRYLLDTNTVSQFVRGHPAVDRHVAQVPMASLAISAITAGELAYGLAKRPDAVRLHGAVREFLLRVDVLPWDREVAEQYGIARAALQRDGTTLAPLDLLIAAHAMSVGTILVTNDRAFSQVAGLTVEDWTA